MFQRPREDRDQTHLTRWDMDKGTKTKGKAPIQSVNSMELGESSKTKQISSNQVTSTTEVEESTRTTQDLPSSPGISPLDITYAEHMLYDECRLLNSQTEPEGHLSYTDLMQQVIQSPKINFGTNQVGLSGLTYLPETPRWFNNSMILTSNRFHDEFPEMDDVTEHALQTFLEEQWIEKDIDKLYNNNNNHQKHINNSDSTITCGEECDNMNPWSLEHNADNENNEMDAMMPIGRDSTQDNQELRLEQEDGGNSDEIDSRHIPHEGMKFKTDVHAYNFFNFYAYLVGFSIVIAHSYKTANKKRNNEIIKYTYKCNRHGTNEDSQKKYSANKDSQNSQGQPKKGKRKTNVIVRTDCKCVMVVREDKGIWSIIRLDLTQNHSLCPPEERKFLYSHKNMIDEEKSLILTLKECNIPTRSMVVILASLRGDLSSLPYTKKDVSNVATSINSETRNKDMSQVLQYLRKTEAEDPEFYYKLMLDENNKVKNMFWTDGRSKKMYEEFGDFVSFDTTYKTNKYDLPFAPFVGITGHAKTLLFACAFLGDETTETFKWVFETFKTAMNGNEPLSIITDQDNAMRSAIAQVFKGAKHRNCLFHILKNFREKTGTTFTITDTSDPTKKDLYKDFDDIVHNCLMEQEFETLWPQMIEKYSLENVKYLQLMFKVRATCIPVYFKNDWFPFIQSTALSEGTNARFKREVGPRHSVTSFLQEYERINDRIFDTQYNNDHISSTRRPKTFWSQYYIEEQACQLYNLSIFKKFQLKLEKTLTLQVSIMQHGKAFLVSTALNQKSQEWR